MVLGYIILGTALGLPLLLGMFLRVTTPHLFFSLMAGELLARYFGDDVEVILESVMRLPVVGDYSHVIVLVAPIVLTAIFLRNTLSRAKVVFHFIPLIVTGIVLAAFALPVLPEALRSTVDSTEAGKRFLDIGDVIIGGVVILQLVTLWILNKSSEHHKKHH